MIQKMSTFQKNKKILRKTLLTKRKIIAQNELIIKSQKLVNHLVEWISQYSFEEILIYYPILNEPDIILLTDQLKNTVTYAIPLLIDDKDMVFQRWDTSYDLLYENKFKIKELKYCKEKIVSPNKNTLICIPAVAVDKDGNRIGYGKGFYDRYLNKFSKITTIAIIFEDFFLDNIPSDPWDIKISKVCTENGIKNIL